MNRSGTLERLTIILGLASLLAIQPALGESNEGGKKAIHEALEACQQEKCSVVLYVKGQTIPIIVTKVGNGTVAGRNQTHDRILIRLDRIDAIAR